MTNVSRYLLTAGFLAATLLTSVSTAQITSTTIPFPGGPVAVPPVPDNLVVPEGNVAFLTGHARGTQNYVCLPSVNGFAWTFFSPQATLFTDLRFGNVGFQQQIITHFLSPNPAEGNTSRVTWQSSQDTSAVWAKAAPNGTSVDPLFVAPNAIPWVKLQALGTQFGPTGGDLLAHTTFVQRLNTQGGVAPSTGCSEAANVGATVLVPYTADYFFYRAGR